MTEQELMQEALEWREHIAKLAADYSDQELFRKRLATIEWLIEKAELAIELEEEIEKWRKVKDATVKLAKEKERYKQALETIRNMFPMRVGTSYEKLSQIGKTVEKALEDDKNDR